MKKDQQCICKNCGKELEIIFTSSKLYDFILKVEKKVIIGFNGTINLKRKKNVQ